MVKCLATMRETWVQFRGWEDPLEKEMATHSSTLSWKIPWTEERGRLRPMESQRVRHDWATSLHYIFQHFCWNREKQIKEVTVLIRLGRRLQMVMEV